MSTPIDISLISRLNDQPMLVARGREHEIEHALRRFSAACSSPESMQESEDFARAELLSCYGFAQHSPAEKPYAFANGVAIIPVTGLLLNRFGRSWGWVTGYNAIRAQLNAAIADDDVKGIIFDVNSYGGEAAGCFELSEEIRAARALKPSLAVVDSAAYSAGYALGSAASRMVCIKSGGVGSIGVIAMHMDISEAMREWGVKVTLIYAGEHKADGNPYTPLPEGVRAAIQENVDVRREEFVTLVAANRGLDTEVVRNTEADTYRAEEAVEIGLIDEVATPLTAASNFISELSGSEPMMETTKMSNTTEQPGGDKQTPPDNTAAIAQAVAADRQRASAIRNHEHAKDRPALANHLADAGMSVDDAAAIMAVAAKETPQAAAPGGKSQFEAAMDQSGGTGVSADGEQSGTGENMSAEQKAARILANAGIDVTG